MRILCVLAIALLSGCVLDSSLGDLPEVDPARRVRERIASPVWIEMNVEYYPFSSSLFTRLARGGRTSREIAAANQREAVEYLGALGVFGEPDPVDDSNRASFGGAEGAADRMRVRLTLHMDPVVVRTWNCLGAFTLAVLPTWRTVRRDLVAEVYDSSGYLLLSRRYDERHRQIRWLPFALLWPFRDHARRARIRRQIDHFLVDLRESLSASQLRDAVIGRAGPRG
ncbi:MAG: hypothetical protein AAF517_02060 [Planctomycetota bacterium]